MLKLFRRRSPAHRAHQTPTDLADVLVASAWGLNLSQWWGLSEFERSECRRNVTAAPRFVS